MVFPVGKVPGASCRPRAPGRCSRRAAHRWHAPPSSAPTGAMMNARRAVSAFAAALLAAFSVSVPLGAQQVDPALYQGLVWREIGPYRGGRTKAVVGVPSQPGSVLRRLRERGCVEEHRLRTGVEAHLRLRAHGLHRRAGRGPFGSERDLRGQRRGDAASGPHRGRRHLQVRATAARPGPTWDCATASRSPRSRWIPVTRTASSWRCWAIRTAPTRSGACSAPPTAGRPSRRSSTRDRRWAPPTSRWIPQNPDVVYADLWESQEGPWENARFSGPASGLFKSHRRRAPPGDGSGRASPRASRGSGASASASLPAGRHASMPSWARPGRLGGRVPERRRRRDVHPRPDGPPGMGSRRRLQRGEGGSRRTPTSCTRPTW